MGVFAGNGSHRFPPARHCGPPHSSHPPIPSAPPPHDGQMLPSTNFESASNGTGLPLSSIGPAAYGATASGGSVEGGGSATGGGSLVVATGFDFGPAESGSTGMGGRNSPGETDFGCAPPAGVATATGAPGGSVICGSTGRAIGGS